MPRLQPAGHIFKLTPPICPALLSLQLTYRQVHEAISIYFSLHYRGSSFSNIGAQPGLHQIKPTLPGSEQCQQRQTVHRRENLYRLQTHYQ